MIGFQVGSEVNSIPPYQFDTLISPAAHLRSNGLDGDEQNNGQNHDVHSQRQEL